jgi:hypothetical protein
MISSAHMKSQEPGAFDQVPDLDFAGFSINCFFFASHRKADSVLVQLLTLAKAY